MSYSFTRIGYSARDPLKVDRLIRCSTHLQLLLQVALNALLDINHESNSVSVIEYKHIREAILQRSIVYFPM